MKATINTLDNVVVKRPSDKQNLCLDKGYDFLEVQRSSIKRRYMPRIRYRGEEKDDDIKKNRKYLAKRWAVERTNSWHNGFRKLLIAYATLIMLMNGALTMNYSTDLERKV